MTTLEPSELSEELEAPEAPETPEEESTVPVGDETEVVARVDIEL